jgi:hypothetical protein
VDDFVGAACWIVDGELTLRPRFSAGARWVLLDPRREIPHRGA